jgi:hypothetical protein
MLNNSMGTTLKNRLQRYVPALSTSPPPFTNPPLPPTGGSIIVKQIGHSTLAIAPPSQLRPSQYLITLPRLRINGLWYSSPYIELAESSYIIGITGWVAVLECKGKGYFGGKSRVFKAVLSAPEGKEGGNREHGKGKERLRGCGMRRARS